MRVLVTGATGYIGGRLVPRLLQRGHAVGCFARDAERLAGRFPNAEIFEGDLFDEEALSAALRDVEAAYYLIHFMGSRGRDFADLDRRGAEAFGRAARQRGVRRIVYLGGLGADDDRLSKHLRSRHEVGETLRRSGVPVTEFRAAMIVGSGSASFEMMRYLTERLPAMIAPKWVDTPCQPVYVRDVLAYLEAELERAGDGPAIFEIGGADVLSYKTMMLRYAAIRGLRRRLIVVPFFTPRLSSAWVHLVTPIPSSIARPLIDGLHNPVVVRNDDARRVFPSIVPLGFDDAVRRALDRYTPIGPETTWFDAFDVRRLPAGFSGATQGMLIDRRERQADASAQALFAVFTSLGGKRGWLFGNGLWRLRGLLDRLVGGIGLRRGRRSETNLRVGDALDFWRVEAYDPEVRLRLRAEMRLPGRAWLEFDVIRRAGRRVLRQTAFFEPHGFLGYLYWFSVLPFHALIFGNMIRRIVEEAGRLETTSPVSASGMNGGTARVSAKDAP